MTYRDYGYPWRWAILGEICWRIEKMPAPRKYSVEGPPWPFSVIGCWAYRMRKACEHRGSPLLREDRLR